jgi:hypothetical protein
MTDAEMRNELLGVRDIALHTVRHKHAYNTVLAKRLYAECRNYARVLSARYTNNGITALTVYFKPITYPFDNALGYFLYAKHYFVLL